MKYTEKRTRRELSNGTITYVTFSEQYLNGYRSYWKHICFVNKNGNTTSVAISQTTSISKKYKCGHYHWMGRNDFDERFEFTF